jgi:hypothetical protein
MSIPNSTPIFVGLANFGHGVVSVANANRDGTGTVVVVFTAGLYGSRVHRLRIKAAVTTTAGMVRLFINDGAAKFLYKEIPVSAITASATVETFVWELQLANEDALILPTGYTLLAATEKAEAINVFAEGGDF